MADRPRAQLLVVDDDADLRDLLVMVLEHDGYRVTAVADGPAALAHIEAGPVDLVILDVGLAEGDGRLVLRRLRQAGELPVILISGQGEAADRVLGLRLGADDFLAKPFSPVELAARVETVLRRASRRPEPGDARPAGVGVAPTSAAGPAGGLQIDEATREVVLDERRLELTAREFDLLAFLARSPRQVFSRGQLLEHVWQSQSGWQDEATVTEHVRRVRHKVEADPEHPRWITTVRGVGYRFEP